MSLFTSTTRKIGVVALVTALAAPLFSANVFAQEKAANLDELLSQLCPR